MAMEWDNYRKRIKNIEITVGIIIVVFFVIGSACDCLASLGKLFVRHIELEDVSLTIIPVQATIITLTITVVTLLSGSIKDSYMGVPVSRYFLEIHPYFFRQKRIVIIEFLGLALSVILYLIGSHFTLVLNFMVTVVFVLLSFLEIYEVFKGRRSIQEIILSYIMFSIDNNENYLELGEAYISDWKNIVLVQSKEEFDLYYDTLFRLVVAILNRGKRIEDVNILTYNISRFLLSHDSINCRIKGIRLIRKYYDDILCWINDNQDYVKEIETSIVLISKLEREWFRAFESIDAEVFENEDYGFEHFSDAVIKVSSWIGFSDNSSYEVNAINNIARGIGKYVYKQRKKGNEVNLKYWQGQLYDTFRYRASMLPSYSQTYYRESLALRDFSIVYGFLLSGQLEIIKEGLFCEELSSLFSIKEKEYVLKIMMIHCYLYYYAFRESEECVEVEIQNKVKVFLQDDDIVKTIQKFYYRLFQNPLLLDEQIEIKMENMLRNHEQFPKHSSGKFMILDEVIKEYFLYVSLMTLRNTLKEDRFENVLNVRKYYMWLSVSNLDGLKKRFIELSSIFDLKKMSDDKVSERIDNMLVTFSQVMKGMYKKHIIEEARSGQKKYEIENKQDVIEAELKERVEKRINETIRGFDASCDNEKTYNKVNIFHIKCDTAFIEEAEMDFSDYAVARFSNWLLYELEKSYGINTIKRKDFYSDRKFREYIVDNEYKILFGDECIFGSNDFEEYAEHEDFLDSMECKYVLGGNKGIALRKDSLFVNINKLYVTINSLKTEDLLEYINRDTGLYNYSTPSEFTLEFEEGEFKQFINDQKKGIDIYADVIVGVKSQSAGVIIKE